MPTKTYKTLAEAEKVRKAKQKQFPNFYVKIKNVITRKGKREFYITVA